MGKARPVVIVGGKEEYLSLVLQATKGLAMDNPISVMLESRPDVARRFRHEPAPCVSTFLGIGGKKKLFSLLQSFSDIHCRIVLCLFDRKQQALMPLAPQFITWEGLFQ
jgi:hypothetical protein